jgi:hypothetical protein
MFRFKLFWVCLLAASSLPGAEEFRLTTRPLRIPERGIVTSMVLMTESNRFSFLPPAGWRPASNPVEKKISLQPRDYSATLVFKITPLGTNSTPELNLESLRAQIAERYPESKILREFESPAMDSRARVFDIEWVVNRKNKVAMRLAFAAYAGGRVEFNLTAPPEKLSRYHVLFGTFMTSFHVEPPLPKPPADLSGP